MRTATRVLRGNSAQSTPPADAPHARWRGTRKASRGRASAGLHRAAAGGRAPGTTAFAASGNAFRAAVQSTHTQTRHRTPHRRASDAARQGNTRMIWAIAVRALPAPYLFSMADAGAAQSTPWAGIA
jgi:hypothetical protein